MRKSVMVALVAAGALAGARTLLAQACVGVPAGEGGWTVAPVLRVRPIASSNVSDIRFYGGDVAVNVKGRLGFEGGYAHARYPEGVWGQDEYRVRPSLELLRARNASLCLVTGAQLGYRPRYDVSITDSLGNRLASGWLRERDFRFPLGVAAGAQRLVAGHTLLSLYAVPQVLFVRFDQRMNMPARGESDVVYRTNQLGLEAGARVRRGPVFGGVSWQHLTWSGPPNVSYGTLWTFTVGFAHGR